MPLITLAQLDVELLSRIQFAFTIAFHYLFPPLTIGLGVIMVGLEWRYLQTKDLAWERACKFWTKLFAVNFALGVATGIVMEFQFGTNWAVYSRFVGDVFGSALAAEAIFAFFLESGFLAVLVFGWDRVGPKMHFFSTLMVALGSAFSAVWIVVANSWQQTPAGHHIVSYEANGQIFRRAEVTDFWAMVFNPSSVERLTHVYIGALILGSFFVLSISAWYLLKNKHLEFARKSFKIALVLGTIGSVLALVQGHMQAQNVYEYQPQKIAAFDGHYQNDYDEQGNPEPAALAIFGIPNSKTTELDYAVRVPGLLSFMVHDSFEDPVKALQEFPEDERPPLWIPFISWRLMIGLGMFFIALTLVSCFFWWRGTLFDKRWLLWTWVPTVVGAYIANQAGWFAAEVGRQPWIVWPVTDEDGNVIHEGLRTSEGLSNAVDAEPVLASLIGFGMIYLLLFVLWLFVMNNKIQHGPEPPPGDTPKPDEAERPTYLDVASLRAGEEGRMAGAERASARTPDDDGAKLLPDKPRTSAGEDA
jgi:cytochrome d ubiquinol oxidase subunit I